MGRSFEAVQRIVDEHKVTMIDLKTTDLSGKLHHISLPVKRFTRSLLQEGTGFDGSSFGFSRVESSDMVQIPDIDTAVLDPFRTEPTLSFFTRIHLTDENRSRFSQDPRWIAENAERQLLESGVADQSWWGPEYEFYIFQKVEYDTRTSASYYYVHHAEEFHHNAYHAANPQDRFDDFRDQAVRMMMDLGIDVKYHHHEVGERGQQEIEVMFDTLLRTGDHAMLTKYILFNMAARDGLRVTFMPKPLFQQSGSGWHVHQFLTNQGKNIFYGQDGYGRMNPAGLHYIGGILKHAHALSALTNPSTNSYKRLVPGFEAPVAVTFGKANRSSAVRIPSYISDPEKTRLEYRPPDATANPYLALSAMLMAGLDGIINEIDPVKEGFGPFDVNVFDDSMAGKFQFLPRDLEQALQELEKDHEFLMRGNVFTEELIHRWIKVKKNEIMEIATMPNPFEYKLYFDV